MKKNKQEQKKLVVKVIAIILILAMFINIIIPFLGIIS